MHSRLVLVLVVLASVGVACGILIWLDASNVNFIEDETIGHILTAVVPAAIVVAGLFTQQLETGRRLREHEERFDEKMDSVSGLFEENARLRRQIDDNSDRLRGELETCLRELDRLREQLRNRGLG